MRARGYVLFTIMASSQREYERGYHDGREGKSFNDGSELVLALMTLGFAGESRENSKDYKEGFREGREDKNRK